MANILKSKLYKIVKRSKKTGKIYVVEVGQNGEKLNHSQGYTNESYVRQLMKRYASMGFIIEWDA